METEIEKLIELASLDREIAGLQRKLDEVPRAIETRRGEYLGSERRLEQARGELAAMQKEHRKAEGALEGHLEKVRKLNAQTSLVKTNKEYQTLLAEIENLKKEQDRYEERILDLMEKSAEEEKRIKGIAGEVAVEKKAFDQDEATLLAEADELKGQLLKLEEGRAGLLPSIDGETLHLYNKVKGLRGEAVAEVRDELCLGCRVRLTPQQYADIMTKPQLQTCFHCQRILFFRKTEG